MMLSNRKESNRDRDDEEVADVGIVDYEKPLVKGLDGGSNSNNNTKDYHGIENIEGDASSSSALEEARKLLYVSHLFAKGSEIGWQFCVILFLAAFTKYESLFLVSTYGIFSQFIVFACGGGIGEYVDQTPRLKTARFFILWENTSVVLATICCYILFQLEDISYYHRTININDNNNHSSMMIEPSSSSSSSWWYQHTKDIPTSWDAILCLIGIHFFGAMANVLDKGFTVAVEKDWIVVMSQQAKSLPTSTVTEDGVVIEGSTTNNETTSLLTELQQLSTKMWLAQTNITMTQIDLGCKAIAPTVAGFLLATFDGNHHPKTTTDTDHGSTMTNGATNFAGVAVFLGVLNFVALLVEWFASSRIYHLVPSLSIKSNSNKTKPNKNVYENNNLDKCKTQNDNDDTNTKLTSYSSIESTIESNEKEDLVIMNPTISSSSKSSPTTKILEISTTKSFVEKSIGHWQIYLKQPVCGGGISLALLYLNVLTFHDFMTAYLVWRGMNLEAIGVCRGISNVIGLMGTVAYHYSVKRISVQATGMWSIVYQFSCLSFSYASLFIHFSTTDPSSNNNNTSFSMDTALILLVGGVCASRIGLWVFDISITQLMQEHIPENERGVVGGVQESLHAFFGIISYMLGLLFPDPAQFFILAVTGYVSVGLAILFYFFGIYLPKIQKANNQ